MREGGSEYRRRYEYIAIDCTHVPCHLLIVSTKLCTMLFMMLLLLPFLILDMLPTLLPERPGPHRGLFAIAASVSPSMSSSSSKPRAVRPPVASAAATGVASTVSIAPLDEGPDSCS